MSKVPFPREFACSASFLISDINRKSPTSTASALGTALCAEVARSAFRAWRTTEWPWSARTLAAAWPMPSLEPVMNMRAIFLWILKLGWLTDVAE